MSAAEAARTDFRAKLAREQAAAAKAAAAERRSPAVLGLRTSPQAGKAFAWVDGEPRAGARAYVVYNKAAGGPLLRAAALLLHLGSDGWNGKQKQARAPGALSLSFGASSLARAGARRSRLAAALLSRFSRLPLPLRHTPTRGTHRCTSWRR